MENLEFQAPTDFLGSGSSDSIFSVPPPPPSPFLPLSYFLLRYGCKRLHTNRTERSLIIIQPNFVQGLHNLLIQSTVNDTVQVKAVNTLPTSPSYSPI